MFSLLTGARCGAVRLRAAVALGGSPQVSDLRAARHVEAMAHQEHRRIVLLLVVAAYAVVGDHHVVVAEHRVPRRRLHAALRGASADDDGPDAVAAQQELYVRAPERARPVLADHDFARERSELLDEIVPWRAGHGVPQGRSSAPGGLV